MSEPSVEIGILVLAAGRGERFRAAGGQGNKLLARYEDASGAEQPLLALTLTQARQSGLPIHLVTRPDEAEVIALAQQFGVGLTLIYSQGSGESIAAGVRATTDWNGWLIVPGDMGWVTAQDYRQVAAALKDPNAQARMMWQGKPGHPVGFGGDYREALAALEGDSGARELLVPERLIRLSGQARVTEDADLPR